MELRKGENMIEHASEIYSRPARTWFQSAKEKRKAEGLSHIILDIVSKLNDKLCSNE
jgi:ATP-dependent RNA helicase DDX27